MKADIKAAILRGNHSGELEVVVRDGRPGQYQVDITGQGFTNPEPLLRKEIISLNIKNTRLNSTAFLSQAPLNHSLEDIALKGNNLINDNYAGLTGSNAMLVTIINADNFVDASVLGPHACQIWLYFTGVKQLNFTYPQAILGLNLRWNSQLTDITKINQMHQLQSLSVDQLDGIDFTNLPNLHFFWLDYSDSAREFPQLHRQSTRQLGVDHCPNLENIESLRNMTVGELDLIAITEKQLRLFTPVLLTMQIEKLVVFMDEPPTEVLVAPLLQIPGLKQLRLNPDPPIPPQ